MSSAAELFALTIYNCSNRDIVVRYVPRPPNKGGRLLLTARGYAVIQDAYAGMELFAALAAEEMTSYARVTVSGRVAEVHFTESSGNLGRGVMPDPPAEPPSGLGTRQPRQQPAMYDPGEFLTAPTGFDGAQLAAPLDATAAAPQSTETSGRGDGMEYVPGMGYMRVSDLKPELQARIREMQKLEREQEGGLAAAPAAPPQYTQRSAFLQQQQTHGENWKLPALILLVLVLGIGGVVYCGGGGGGGPKKASRTARR